MLTFFASLQPIKNLLSSHDKTHERELRDKILPNFLAGSGQEAGRRPRPRPGAPRHHSGLLRRGHTQQQHRLASAMSLAPALLFIGDLIFFHQLLFSLAWDLPIKAIWKSGHQWLSWGGHKVKNFTQYNRPPFYITYFIRTKRCQCVQCRLGVVMDGCTVSTTGPGLDSSPLLHLPAWGRKKELLTSLFVYFVIKVSLLCLFVFVKVTKICSCFR